MTARVVRALWPMMDLHTQTVETLLRDWRRLRRLSQLDLTCEADISSRRLSFLLSLVNFNLATYPDFVYKVAHRTVECSSLKSSLNARPSKDPS